MTFDDLKKDVKNLIENLKSLKLVTANEEEVIKDKETISEKDLGKGDSAEENKKGKGETNMENSEEKKYSQADVDKLVHAAEENIKSRVESGKELLDLKAENASFKEKINILTRDKDEAVVNATKIKTEFDEFKADLSKKEIAEARMIALKEKGIKVDEKEIETVKGYAKAHNDEEWNKFVGILESAITKASKTDTDKDSNMVDKSKEQGNIVTASVGADGKPAITGEKTNEKTKPDTLTAYMEEE